MKKTSAVHGPQPWPPEEHKVCLIKIFVIMITRLKNPVYFNETFELGENETPVSNAKVQQQVQHLAEEIEQQ